VQLEISTKFHYFGAIKQLHKTQHTVVVMRQLKNDTQTLTIDKK